MSIHRPYEKKPKQVEDIVPVPQQLRPKNEGELPNTQQEGGQHVNEGNGDFKPPKQPSGPYDRDKQSTDKPAKTPS